MNAKNINRNREDSIPMMEQLETRELYSVSALPAVQCPSDPSMLFINQIVSPRDPASGLPTGK